jgi:hypothetical protein
VTTPIKGVHPVSRTLRHLGASVSLVAALLVAPTVAGTAHAQDNIAGILPEPALAGANDFACKPTQAHPRPVVLVHGLGATATENWHFFAPYLKSRGFCVFALTYGVTDHYPGRGGVAPMERSAEELAGFVAKVQDATGARKVDMVGHSEGGIMPRYYLKFLGGAAHVANFVGWAAPNHGTTISGLTRLREGIPGFDEELGHHCGSCPQFMIGSEFLQKLNSGPDETVGSVLYTVLVTRYDGVVTPLQTSFLTGDHVKNVVLQDVNPEAFPEHVAMAGDPTTFDLTLAALGAGEHSPHH